MRKALQLDAGARFTRLVLTRKRDDLPLNKWEAVCDCGKTIIARSSELANGHVKSCGCMRLEMGAINRFRHGMTKTPEYRAWRSIMGRCRNPRNKAYLYYGGRGIECRFKTFEEFYSELGPRPVGGKYSVDRIDVNGHYCVGNCRWATSIEQGENRTDNLYITWQGKTQHLSAWARELGMSKDCLQARVTDYGWSIQRAMTEPVGHYKQMRMTSR